MTISRTLSGIMVAAASLAFAAGCGPQGNTGSDSGAHSNANSAGATQEDIGEVLAEVNGMKIGTKEFDTLYARALPRSKDKEGGEEARKKEVIERLVNDKLLYQEALRQGIDKDPKIRRMMINQLLRKDVYSTLRNSDISDDELKQYFEEHRESFIVPERRQVRRILIKIEDGKEAEAKAKAEKLLAQVKANPDSFKEVAIKESQDAFARRGGDLGFISKKGKPGIDEDIVKKAFELGEGEFSDVFKTKDGYNIIQVVNIREQVERSFEQMKGAVLRKLKTERSRKRQEEYIAQLKSGAKIKIYEDKLKAHPVPEKPAMENRRALRRPPGMPNPMSDKDRKGIIKKVEMKTKQNAEKK